jgi:hypothetical protein
VGYGWCDVARASQKKDGEGKGNEEEVRGWERMKVNERGGGNGNTPLQKINAEIKGRTKEKQDKTSRC